MIDADETEVERLALVIRRETLEELTEEEQMTQVAPAALTFTLTTQEADLLMSALAQRPYIEVVGLIAKLVSQANQQRTDQPDQPA